MPNLAAFGLRAVTAAEIEFYVREATPAVWEGVKLACKKTGIDVQKIEKERGEWQYEIALTPAKPEKTVADLQALKTILAPHADFSAKPFADQPGSGLHIHIHLEDSEGKNVFYKDDTRMSDALRFSLAGLLANMPEDMGVFAPTEHSRKRFVPGSNAPLTLSWGANNRTTALRLPDSAHDKKRIEHRVAGADADVAKVMEKILAAIVWGLEHKPELPPQIYGDASDAQYHLPKLFP